jgi:type IV secretion system protein VirD4
MNARQGQSFPLESIKAAIGAALVGGLLLPLVLGVLLQLVTGWRLPLSFWPLLAALGALSGGWHGFKGASLNSAPVAPDLGRARFAHDAEIDALTRHESNSLAIGWTPGAKAGEWPLLYYSGPGHLLTIAPTRSGKGVGSIVPNLLTADRSVFVIDPKGENAKITARQRRAFGPVFILDPFEVSGQAGAAFNPLALMSAESLDLAEDAATLADALVLDNGDAKDSHWNDEAKALISGIIMYVAASEKPEARNLDRVRQYLTLPQETFKAFLQEMADSKAAHGLIARTGGRFLGKTGVEFAGVISTAQRHTQFLDSPRIARALSRSDFSFADLVAGVASVFVVLPPDRLETYNRWLRLMINAALRDLARAPQRPARPILFLLDEFAALGRLDEVRRGMGLMAGYSVQLWPIFQDFSQLAAIYGKSAETFFANAEVVQAFNVQDLETAKKLSEFMGDKTISYTTTTQNSGESSQGGFGGKISTNTGEGVATHFQARRLMKPEEILTLMDGIELLFVKNYRPFQAGKIRYFERPEFAGLYDPA